MGEGRLSAANRQAWRKALNAIMAEIWTGGNANEAIWGLIRDPHDPAAEKDLQGPEKDLQPQQEEGLRKDEGCYRQLKPKAEC